jgi:hypothetical protein
MFKWIYNALKPKNQLKKKWVGNICAQFTHPDHENEAIFTFYYQLFVDEEGNRSYSMTGNWMLSNPPETHGRFSTCVYPWLQGGSDFFVWEVLNNFDNDYWIEQIGEKEVESKLLKNLRTNQPLPSRKSPEKPKPEFKLLSFPCNEEKKEDILDAEVNTE